MADKSDPVALIKAAEADADAACKTLEPQLARTEQFAAELRTKLFRARIRREYCQELLTTFEPEAKVEAIISNPSGVS